MSYMKPPTTAKPHMIIMVGIPGAGKSFFAERFAKTFKSPIINIEKIHQTLFINPKYDEIEKNIVKNSAEYLLNELFKTGKTIIYDGPANKKAERTEISKNVRKAGYEPIFVWVQTDSVTAKKRSTKAVGSQPLMTNAEFENCLKQFNALQPNEQAVVISGKHTYNAQLKIVLKSIVNPPRQTNLNKSTTNNRLIQ